MGFKSEKSLYLDQDGLIGASPKPPKWSGGNQILDTAVYMHCLNILGELTWADKDFIGVSLLSCENPLGKLNKNPGRPDEITHDCVIGAAAISNMCLVSVVDNMIDRQKTPIWVFSNTAKIYWDSIVKPWHKAFYKHLSRQYKTIFGYLWLSASILHDSLFNKTNASDKRVMWVTILSTITMPVKIPVMKQLMAWAIKHWFNSFDKLGGETWMFSKYYPKEDPYVKYADEIKQKRQWHLSSEHQKAL